MNGNQNPQGASVAFNNNSFPTLTSNRASPFPPNNLNAAATNPKMAASTFIPQNQSFRPPGSSQPHYPPLSMSAVHSYDRSDPSKPTPVGTPYPTSITTAVIRRLPVNTSEESVRLMVVWADDLLSVDVLPPEQSGDPGFRSAIIKFGTPRGAAKAKEMFNGKLNLAKDAEMAVEIVPESPTSTRRFSPEHGGANGSASTTSSNGSSGQPSRQPSRFNGTFQSMDRLSPPMGGGYSGTELPNPETSNHYQSLFSPQSPIGNHLTERPRITGKSLINNDSADDDETGELLKDPVAYAENGANAAQRRAAAPHGLPISGMANMTLRAPGPSMSPYGHPGMGNPMSAHSSTMSPVMNGGGHGMYPMNHQYGRHNFPPVNPADQNPPCNTLYVGNLPVDTSEEELKAMFSKQRGYKRLCFRTKQNGPMCFVEFEDISFATKALHELYGHPLHNSVKGGIRLSFSKNPLGVRSGQNTAQNNAGAMNGMGGGMGGPGNGFTTASGPPPGLQAPPGLPLNRMYGTGPSGVNGGAYHGNNYSNGVSNSPWNNNSYGAGNVGNVTPTSMTSNGLNGLSTPYPAHMMGR
ncbi:hypothetical protein MKZ38_006849 [Zalerion maritima]|uniref:RRM domain-containing protein n=1 Tax=Zalerion maritima TaxID=339359 RepID=A0AAD5RIK3_9PEZI|nr:hypothetical protein MKZ38_006849 [Zalerion maritima]